MQPASPARRANCLTLKTRFAPWTKINKNKLSTSSKSALFSFGLSEQRGGKTCVAKCDRKCQTTSNNLGAELKSGEKFIAQGNCRARGGKLRALFTKSGHNCILRPAAAKALKVISAPLSKIFLVLNKLVRWHELYQRALNNVSGWLRLECGDFGP